MPEYEKCMESQLAAAREIIKKHGAAVTVHFYDTDWCVAVRKGSIVTTAHNKDHNTAFIQAVGCWESKYNGPIKAPVTYPVLTINTLLDGILVAVRRFETEHPGRNISTCYLPNWMFDRLDQPHWRSIIMSQDATRHADVKRQEELPSGVQHNVVSVVFE